MRRTVLPLLIACAATLGAQTPRPAVSLAAAARLAVVLVWINGLKPEYVLQAEEYVSRRQVRKSLQTTSLAA